MPRRSTVVRAKNRTVSQMPLPEFSNWSRLSMLLDMPAITKGLRPDDLWFMTLLFHMISFSIWKV
jgi:hypothetical protein